MPSLASGPTRVTVPSAARTETAWPVANASRGPLPCTSAGAAADDVAADGGGAPRRSAVWPHPAARTATASAVAAWRVACLTSAPGEVVVPVRPHVSLLATSA